MRRSSRRPIRESAATIQSAESGRQSGIAGRRADRHHQGDGDCRQGRRHHGAPATASPRSGDTRHDPARTRQSPGRPMTRPTAIRRFLSRSRMSTAATAGDIRSRARPVAFRRPRSLFCRRRRRHDHRGPWRRQRPLRRRTKANLATPSSSESATLGVTYQSQRRRTAVLTATAQRPARSGTTSSSKSKRSSAAPATMFSFCTTDAIGTIDAGCGFDIIKLIAGLDIYGEGGPDVTNFEMVDLTNGGKNIVEFEGGAIDEHNPDDELRIIGDAPDASAAAGCRQSDARRRQWPLGIRFEDGRITDEDAFGAKTTIPTASSSTPIFSSTTTVRRSRPPISTRTSRLISRSARHRPSP